MNPDHRRNLCRQFLVYLLELPRGTLDIESPDTWLPNAATASGGAGNPEGSVIAIDKPAIEPIRKQILTMIWRLRDEEAVSQILFDDIYFKALTGVINEVNSHSPATNFTFGRSQKLINIYIKTLYAGFWGDFRGTGEDGKPIAWLGRWSGCLHVPVDRQTLKYFDQEPGHRHLTRIGSKLKSWKWDLQRTDYAAVQDLARRTAAERDYLDPLHFEMDQVWTQPSAPPHP